MDKKILGIISYDFAEGVKDSFDSFPEEQECINKVLASGNTDIFDEAPVILSCCTNDLQAVEEFDIQNIPTTSGELNHFISDNDKSCNENNISERLEPISTTTPISVPTKTISKRRINTEKLGVQLSEARETFQAIEEQNVQIMKSLARNMQMQAEASFKLVDAALIIAENDRKRNDIIERMIENDRVRNVLLESLTRILENLLPRR
ncbi:uncharacterized protein LOC113005670 [Solenopsis invicta]|uniref:uncharacterized protein LOC113005670 n=1 Tax=Solenopsis invicta TaxID=13686 RepID=UPI000E33FBCA|nr:uncharacterized protein LOC113005670 [Solenopsis invicta]XP_039303702.1 uncharacterized protein LOC113005670 [Solenopsis invicta]XP_039303703.1 uncharacterized protein LOC113005670 [Solenopsis invicta]XP_039303704.1 uncharacterized protein LOC113005670 [Solenopsis invicta]XP_039303705.1 uncharacterized protein LOC113005670 [Solenopsis invicta]